MHWCEGVRSPVTGSSDSYNLPCGCWELNLGPLEEQSVLLTTEPSLQPRDRFSLQVTLAILELTM